jgi:hypothetical protein
MKVVASWAKPLDITTVPSLSSSLAHFWTFRIPTPHPLLQKEDVLYYTLFAKEISGIDSWQWQKFVFQSVQTLDLRPIGYRVACPRCEKGWSVNLSHLHLTMILRRTWKWSHNSTPTYVFMASCLVKKKNSFYFTVILFICLSELIYYIYIECDIFEFQNTLKIEQHYIKI